MKNFIIGTLISSAIFYMAGSLAAASFDIPEWSKSQRVVIGGFWATFEFIIGVVSIAALPNGKKII